MPIKTYFLLNIKQQLIIVTVYFTVALFCTVFEYCEWLKTIGNKHQQMWEDKCTFYVDVTNIYLPKQTEKTKSHCK